jgi:hypothetical protein
MAFTVIKYFKIALRGFICGFLGCGGLSIRGPQHSKHIVLHFLKRESIVSVESVQLSGLTVAISDWVFR